MRFHGLRLIALVSLLGLAVACEDAPTNGPLSVEDETLVYGADDRLEYYEITEGDWQTLADGTVAVFDTGDLWTSGGGYALDTSQTFASAYRLCSWEPFRDQPTSAFCTGFQVGPDLVATAGHCVDAAACGDTAFVFGFRMDGPGTLRDWVPADDVYFCSQVVARAETSTDDWAVVRVDRPIVGHQPLPIRRSGTVANGTPLVVAGHPAGIPFKIAGGASVKDGTPSTYFEANLDTYGGNSGSPVMNDATGVIEGILVRGNTDFVYVKKSRCYESNVCSDGRGCRGSFEDASKITRIASYVPDVPSCAVDADCDNGAPCDGAEACVAGHCQPGAPVGCGDGDACTDDACVATGATTYVCDHAALTCDDDDPCTTDVCDSASGCVFTDVVCGAGEFCDGGVCVPEPVCFGRGVTCTSGAECCSGQCHPKKGTCK